MNEASGPRPLSRSSPGWPVLPGITAKPGESGRGQGSPPATSEASLPLRAPRVPGSQAADFADSTRARMPGDNEPADRTIASSSIPAAALRVGTWGRRCTRAQAAGTWDAAASPVPHARWPGGGGWCSGDRWQASLTAIRSHAPARGMQRARPTIAARPGTSGCAASGLSPARRGGRGRRRGWCDSDGEGG